MYRLLYVLSLHVNHYCFCKMAFTAFSQVYRDFIENVIRIERELEVLKRKNLGGSFPLTSCLSRELLWHISAVDILPKVL